MISQIVALDWNRLIGNNNELPWYLSEDLKYFKSKTLNKPVIQGRKTFESILSQLGKPLPKRTNLILTSDPTYEANYDNCYVYNSIEDILNEYKLHGDNEEVFIIGGGTLFEQFLPYTDRLYLTEIHEEFEGNVYYPDVDMSEWEMVSSQKGIKDEKNPYDYYFNVYEKINYKYKIY